MIEGIPDLTRIPPASHLVFSGGSSIAVDMENGPCQCVVKLIEAQRPGKGARLVAAARLPLGDAVCLHVPPLIPCAPLAG